MKITLRHQLTIVSSLILATTVLQVSALTADVFLDGSVIVTGVQSTPTSTNGSSSEDMFLIIGREKDSESLPHPEVKTKRFPWLLANTETTSNGKVDRASTSSEISFWTRLTSLFGAKEWETAHPVEKSSTIRVQTFAQTKADKISATEALITWSPRTFSNIRVYYGTSSPILIHPNTAYAEPKIFWSKHTVSLEDLEPNTTYFYKVVGETKFGTTTSAEASFKTGN